MYFANQSSSHASALSSASGWAPAPTSPGAAAETEAFAEPLVVRFGDPEQVGDDEHRERLRVRADELAAAVGNELVELSVCEPPHEGFVVLQPLGRDESHQQRALAGVRGWVHRHHVLVHRELVSVTVDDGADVVPFERDGE